MRRETGVWGAVDPMNPRSPLLAVCGSRAEAVALAPVILALRARGEAVILAATGEHADLAPAILRECGIVADVDLAVHQPGATDAQRLAAILIYLSPVLTAYRPRMVLVEGDSVSALAGAMAARFAAIPLAHINAGVRTGPADEGCELALRRRLLGASATLHFAPTRRAAIALDREGVARSAIHLSGSSHVDAASAAVARMDSDPGLRAALTTRFPFVAAARRPLVIAALGPAADHAAPASVVAGLARLAGFLEAEILLLPTPDSGLTAAISDRLERLKAVHTPPDPDFLSLVWLLRQARLLITNIGQHIDIAPGLGVRTLILGTDTDHPEALICGAAELVAPRADALHEATRRNLFRAPLNPAFPFGKGTAAHMVADAIAAAGHPLRTRQRAFSS